MKTQLSFVLLLNFSVTLQISHTDARNKIIDAENIIDEDSDERDIQNASSKHEHTFNSLYFRNDLLDNGVYEQSRKTTTDIDSRLRLVISINGLQFKNSTNGSRSGIKLRTSDSSSRIRRSTSNSGVCQSLNSRSVCPWTSSIQTNNTRLPRRIQVAACTSSIPRSRSGNMALSDIRCENVTILKRMKIVDCGGLNCYELVDVPVGCTPAFRCHRYPPP